MRSSDQGHNQISLSGLLHHRNRIAVGLVFLFVLTACGGSGSAGEASDESDTDTTPIVVDVQMADNVFIPTAINVAVGQQVEFAVTNTGAAIHDMRIEETEFKSEPVINPGATSSFTAMFTEAGVYKFVCDYHLPGMVGEITVEG